MNGSFMPLTLGRTWVGTHRTGGRLDHITGLDLVEKDSLVLLENEARFFIVSAHTLIIVIRGSGFFCCNRTASQQSKLPYIQQSSQRHSVCIFLTLGSIYFIFLKHYIILHIGTAFRLNFLPQFPEPK
jgi:hypothetical protein